LFNGKPIDQELIQNRSVSLKKMPKKEEVKEGRQALMDFLQKAMIELGVR
jgi:hypothetical protein